MYEFSTEGAKASWARILRLVNDQPSELADGEMRALILMALALVREAKDKRGGRMLQMLSELYDDAFLSASEREAIVVNENDPEMEKYGVATDREAPALVKAGSTAVPCPICGTATVLHGSVRLCPKHGSKPFEVKDGNG